MSHIAHLVCMSSESSRPLWSYRLVLSVFCIVLTGLGYIQPWWGHSWKWLFHPPRGWHCWHVVYNHTEATVVAGFHRWLTLSNSNLPQEHCWSINHSPRIVIIFNESNIILTTDSKQATDQWKEFWSTLTPFCDFTGRKWVYAMEEASEHPCWRFQKQQEKSAVSRVLFIPGSALPLTRLATWFK